MKDGVVTTLKAGEVTITAKAGEQTATCVITVKSKVIAVTGITLDKTAVELVEGESVTLVATVSPENATDKSVTWTSSDETVATVKDGVVTTLKAGEVTITAKAGEFIATCVVTVSASGTKIAYLCGANETTEAIYIALVKAGYNVTALNYDDMELTEEIVTNDFVGKYEAVVLAGSTSSKANLAKSYTELLGKVNVLSTKAFWYASPAEAGTKGNNPGNADNPSLNLVKVAGYEAHPIYAGITDNEFAVFNAVDAITTGKYLQGNGSFANNTPEQSTLGTANGANCIGEAWFGDKGWLIIPVDGDNATKFSLTADGETLFVNALNYLLAGEKYEADGIEAIHAAGVQWPADIYDITGRMVKKGVTSLEGLQKGLYLINGKKVMIK